MYVIGLLYYIKYNGIGVEVHTLYYVGAYMYTVSCMSILKYAYDRSEQTVFKLYVKSWSSSYMIYRLYQPTETSSQFVLSKAKDLNLIGF